ncbi:MAG: polyribonucleotide nucleotidyltransferase, partial [Defluviitaleaceae bacterium]|nr:polyribonucleotide nucleotidyltransferase [Defluviitaleaceae bacterium]
MKEYTIEIAGKKLTAEIGKLAELANSSVLIKYGETTVLITATASEKPREGIDFFPLSVDYEERFYAVGKIPGGFIKREGRPTEKAILASRLIDRPIRPLFPEDYRNDVSVIATVMGVDQEASPEIAAMIGSSIALSISDIPFAGPTGSTNIGLVNGKLVVNPGADERENSDLHLTVASTKEKVMMIEAGANEVLEQTMFEAIKLAHAENVKIAKFIEEIATEIGKQKHEYNRVIQSEELYEKVKSIISSSELEEAVFKEDKKDRKEAMAAIEAKLIEAFAEDEEALSKLDSLIYKYEKETVRRMILNEAKRPDGRGIKEIRKLTSEVDIVPRTHGSALFSRGQTQVLAVTTLGSMGEVQVLDGLDLSEESKRYMHHYNFPSYSVGETRPSRGPGRREIGHGALAEKALVPVLPSEEDFPYAIRVVSE